ncbi:MAG: tetratricopeptide repeat protein [Planctomycetota bacterium]|jgi:Tfp pilus assembly protein PilF
MTRRHNPGSVRKRNRRALWIGAGLFGLALVVRLAHLYGVSDHPTFLTPIVDSGWYNRIAQSYAEGSPMGPEFFWQVFLYPCFLARIYSLFGYSILCAKIIQGVVGSLVCVLVYLLGKRMLDSRTGVLAGGITALYGPLVFFEGELLATGMAGLWAVVLMLLLLWKGKESSSWFYLVLGLCGGLATLTRVTFLPFCAVMALWLVWTLYKAHSDWKPVLARGTLLLLGFFLVTGAVAYKNKNVTGRFSFLPETGPMNLYMGNNPETDEIMAKRPGAAWDNLLAMPKRHGVKSRKEAGEFFTDRFRSYVFNEPFHFLGRLSRKAVHLAGSREIPSNLDMYAMRQYSPVLSTLMWKVGKFGFPFGILLPLALVGLILHRRRIPLHFYLFLILYSCAIILVFVTARYRTPMIPVLAVPAAAAVFSLVEWIRSKQWSRTFAFMASLCVLAVLISAAGPFAAEEVNYEAEMQFCLGIEKDRLGSYEEAKANYEAALRLDPEYGDAHGSLGILLDRLGKREAALRHLKRAKEINPDLEPAILQLARISYESGETDEAVRHYKEVVRINPRSVDAWQALGRLFGQMGNPEEAAVHLRQASEIEPQSHVIRYQLGVALYQSGRLDEAMSNLRRALGGFERSNDRRTASQIRALMSKITQMQGGS